MDDTTYDLQTHDGNQFARFTSKREIATSSDDLELLGLDHRLVQAELGRWRSLPPEEIGIAAKGNAEGPTLLLTLACRKLDWHRRAPCVRRQRL